MYSWDQPGVSRLVHVFLAPFLWTVIGLILLWRGWGWLESGQSRWMMLVALLLGTLKSLCILDQIAKRSLRRITQLQDGTFVWAVYSRKTWGMVVLMIVAGYILRTIAQPGPLMGTLYCAIGWSLCLSSRLGWQQCFKLVRSHEIIESR
jgi:hypothetical protein